MDAEFACDPANRQAPALGLLNGVPLAVCSGVGLLGCMAGGLRTLTAPLSSAAAMSGLVSSAARAACQRLSRPLRPPYVGGRCEEEPLKPLSTLGRAGVSWLAMISPWQRTASWSSKPSRTSTTAPAKLRRSVPGSVLKRSPPVLDRVVPGHPAAVS